MKKKNLIIVAITFAIALAFFVSADMVRDKEKSQYYPMGVIHYVYGYIWYNNTQYNASYAPVNIYNVGRNEWWNVTTDKYGWYQANLGSFEGPGWNAGENITIYAYGNSSQCWTNWSGSVNGTIPATNKYYNITLEPTVGFYDVGVESINFPSNNSYIYPINHLINVTVKNYGAILNHTFPVEIYISNETNAIVYTNSTIISLQPGEISYVEFLWKPANIQMNYTIFVRTNMTCPHDYIPSTDSKNVSIHVILDTLPPEISNVSATPNIQEFGKYVNITCDVTDNVGVNVVKVNITGPPGFTPVNVTMNEGSYYYNSTYSVIGTYHYFIWANDTSSNSNVSGLYEFTIANDTFPPQFLNISISLSVIPEDTDGIPLWGEKTNISANITDENEIISVKINLTSLGYGIFSMNHINGSNIWYIETNASIGSAIHNGSSYVMHMLEINATDEYGNCNISHAKITVWKNGDVSGDGVINLYDVTYLAKHYFNQPGFEEMHDNVGDVSGDGVINLYDVTYLAKHYFNQPGFEVLK